MRKISDSKTLEAAHGKMEKILTAHKQHLSAEVLAKFREGFDRLGGAVKTAKVRELRPLIDQMNAKQYEAFLSDPANKSLIDEM